VANDLPPGKAPHERDRSERENRQQEQVPRARIGPTHRSIDVLARADFFGFAELAEVGVDRLLPDRRLVPEAIEV
jgi:hypothetical protein